MAEEASEGNVIEQYRKSKKRICRSCNRKLKVDLKNYYKECNHFCCQVDKVMGEIEELRLDAIQLRSEGEQVTEKLKTVESKYSRIMEENSRLQKWCCQLGEEGKRLQSILQVLLKR